MVDGLTILTLIDLNLLSKASSSVFLSAQNHIKQQFRPPSSQRGRVCWAHWADAECSRPAVPSFHHSHLCLTRIRMWFQTRGILAARGYPKARPWWGRDTLGWCVRTLLLLGWSRKKAETLKLDQALVPTYWTAQRQGELCPIVEWRKDGVLWSGGGGVT